MSNELDVRRLIAEVHKRPPLWDVRMAEYKDRTNTPLLWNEIADVLNVDVEHCKRKWKNLRDAYRAEVRRTDRRIDRLKTLGQYDPNRRVTSKWVYFEPMNFINESKRTSYATRSNSNNALLPDNDNTNGSPEDAQRQQQHFYEPGFHSFCDIKMETHHTTTDEDDEEDDKLFQEFNAVATPQAARRLSEGFANAAAAVDFTEPMPEDVVANERSGPPHCKCDKRTDDQVHFLEDLEREEQKLMQSTRKEITRANSVGHVGDADYNFLVSFLPQMKKMSELQNLQFRARMSDLLLNTMSTSSTCVQSSASSGYNSGCSMQCQPMQLQQQHQQQQQQQQLQQQPQLPQLQRAPALPCLELMPSDPPTPVQEASVDSMPAENMPQEQMMQDTDMSSTSSPATVIAETDPNWN